MYFIILYRCRIIRISINKRVIGRTRLKRCCLVFWHFDDNHSHEVSKLLSSTCAGVYIIIIILCKLPVNSSVRASTKYPPLLIHSNSNWRPHMEDFQYHCSIVSSRRLTANPLQYFATPLYLYLSLSPPRSHIKEIA